MVLSVLYIILSLILVLTVLGIFLGLPLILPVLSVPLILPLIFPVLSVPLILPLILCLPVLLLFLISFSVPLLHGPRFTKRTKRLPKHIRWILSCRA